MIGAGTLESLLFEHEEELWPRIEQLAREDPRFRRALTGVWAYDSPMFELREALLEELGEYRNVTVKFVAEPRTFDDADGFDWRAVEIDGMRAGPGLASLLRSIADWMEREASD